MQKIAVFAAVGMLLATAPQALARPVGIEDLKGVVDVSNAQITADGSRVVYQRATMDFATNQHHPQLVVVDVSGRKGPALPIAFADVSSPRWAPDSTHLAFVSTGKGKVPEIFSMQVGRDKASEPTQLTHAAHGVLSYAWSPDGRWLAYVTPGGTWHGPNFEVGDNDFLTREGPVRNEVWLVGADGHGERRLAAGTWTIPLFPGFLPPAMSWRNAHEVAFSVVDKVYPGNSESQRVVIADTTTGRLTDVTPVGTYSAVGRCSPDGSKIAYANALHTSAEYTKDLVVKSLADNKILFDSLKADCNVWGFIGWTPDGQVVFSANRMCKSALFVLSPTGDARQVDLGNLNFNASVESGGFARDGALAFVADRPDRPSEVYYLASLTSKPQRLTNENARFETLDMPEARRVTWTQDSFQEDGVLVVPHGFDPHRKYPMVLHIHGGPVTASNLGWDPFDQALAGRGFVVFEPNYRGSDDLGDKYTYAVRGDLGDGPQRDVMAGIDAVVAMGFVDDKRIGVSGWSNGGFMTAWLIGHSNRFKVALAGAGPYDWLDQYNLSDSIDSIPAYVGVEPRGNYEPAFKKLSAITYVDDIHTPVLIVFDTGDYRVAPPSSYALFRALKNRGRDVTMVAIPAFGHFPGTPNEYIGLVKLWADWFTKRL